MAVFSLAAIGAAAVLGMACHQASLFMHNTYDKPYIIFAIVVSALTLIVCLILSARYSLYTHIGCIAVLAILWLALASYTTDRIGYIQCESLDGQTRPESVSGTDGGQYNAVSWCRELKAMMAFCWFDWGLFMIAIVSWLRLSEHEENTYGEGSVQSRHEDRAMEENRDGIDRFERREGFENGYSTGGMMAPGYTGNGMGPRYVTTVPQQYQTGIPMQPGIPIQQGMTGAGGGQVIYQQPGHDVVIQNGQVTQVPTGMQGVQMQQQQPRFI